MLDQMPAQAVWEEHGVRIDLHHPRMVLVLAHVDDLLPDSNEDPRVKGGHGITSVAALEGAVHYVGHDALCHLHGLVAVDGSLVAAEDAGLVVVLPPEEPLLVASRHHEREAVEAPGGPAGARGHLRQLMAGRRHAGHEADLVRLVAHRALQPALAGAPVEARVFDPSVRLALRDAPAHRGAHLGRGDVVEIGAPAAVDLVLSVHVHRRGMGRKAPALHPRATLRQLHDGGAAVAPQVRRLLRPSGRAGAGHQHLDNGRTNQHGCERSAER
mmetsp:Transcript_70591/g.216294  ORF Transcript_70591/g.216294 Transcript_70591/m.216294 type:complete len:271 (-) Transcript_70591:176-988(-)